MILCGSKYTRLVLAIFLILKLSKDKFWPNICFAAYIAGNNLSSEQDAVQSGDNKEFLVVTLSGESNKIYETEDVAYYRPSYETGAKTIKNAEDIISYSIIDWYI